MLETGWSVVCLCGLQGSRHQVLFVLVTERVRITFAGSKRNSVQLKIGRVYLIHFRKPQTARRKFQETISRNAYILI